MTVTQFSPRIPEPTQPLKAVRPSAPMNSSVLAHVHADTHISAVRRTEESPLELQVGDAAGGTQVVLFVRNDADVIRLIEALQGVYA